MSAQAEPQHVAEASEGAATPHLGVLAERRTPLSPGGEKLCLEDRLIAAGLLGGAAALYGVLIYIAVTAIF
jgi:hypothetical protein